MLLRHNEIRSLAPMAPPLWSVWLLLGWPSGHGKKKKSENASWSSKRI